MGTTLLRKEAPVLPRRGFLISGLGRCSMAEQEDGQTIAPSKSPAPFDQLDFIYSPSRDVASDAAHLVSVLGARLVFAIEAMGTRVAMLELADGPPGLLLTDHLEGERPILIYRVASLEESLRR